MKLIELLGAGSRITVVGDCDQAIYSWRGATLKNFNSFRECFPSAQSERLNINYRCSGNVRTHVIVCENQLRTESSFKILSAAAHLIQKNQNRPDSVHLTASKEEGNKIKVRQCIDSGDQVTYVADTIESYIAAGKFKASECAILYRNNFMGPPFLEELKRRYIQETLLPIFLETMLTRPNRGIGFRHQSQKSMLAEPEVVTMLAYLHLLLNPDDNESFQRVYNRPPRGISEETYQEIIHLNNGHKPHLEKARQ